VIANAGGPREQPGQRAVEIQRQECKADHPPMLQHGQGLDILRQDEAAKTGGDQVEADEGHHRDNGGDGDWREQIGPGVGQQMLGSDEGGGGEPNRNDNSERCFLPVGPDASGPDDRLSVLGHGLAPFKCICTF
jgi:hypothetical protein